MGTTKNPFANIPAPGPFTQAAWKQSWDEIWQSKFRQNQLDLEGGQYINAPPEWGLPKGARLLARHEGDPRYRYSLVLQIGSGVAALNGNKEFKEARRSLITEYMNKGFDTIRLSATEWKEIVSLEERKYKEMPFPFTHEVLEDFCCEMDDGGYLIFRKSHLAPFEIQGRRIVPKVDSLVEVGKGKLALSGLGLICLVENKVYGLVTYILGNIAEDDYQTYVRSAYTYFYAQWAFHACPERIIEVASDEDPFAAKKTTVSKPKTAQKARKPSSGPKIAHIARRIYLRTPDKEEVLRKMERRCQCWYVRGHLRKLPKTGQTVFVHGYFKGPEREKAQSRKTVYVY